MVFVKILHNEQDLINGSSCEQSKPRANREEFSRGVCRYMEDCWRVPRCPFSHYEQDFPQLQKNNPPETLRLFNNIEMWQDC